MSDLMGEYDRGYDDGVRDATQTEGIILAQRDARIEELEAALQDVTCSLMACESAYATYGAYHGHLNPSPDALYQTRKADFVKSIDVGKLAMLDT